MTTQMVLEELNNENVKLLDCTLLEGAITVVTSSEQGKTLNEIVNIIKESSLT